MAETPYTEAYWKERAEEAWAIAECMSDPGTRKAMKAMTSVAQGYERLAEHARRQAELLAKLKAPEIQIITQR